MLRVAILDHHPSVRADLLARVGDEPGVTIVGAAADRSDLWPLLQRAQPRVLVIGQPVRDHATEVCRVVRTRYPGCRVVLYSTHAVAVGAWLAGAHALVDKTAEASALTAAIWAVASGARVLPALTPEMSREAARRLQPDDQAIMAMVLADTAADDVAAVTGLSRRELEARRAAILASLAGRRRTTDAGPRLAA